MFTNPKSVFQQKLKESLSKEASSVISDLMRLALLKKAEKDEDLLVYAEIYNLLGPEKFVELVQLVDGRPLELPSKDEFKDTLTTVLCYYYKNVEQKSWEDIKSLVGEPDLNTIKFGIRATTFGSFIDTMMGKLYANQRS
jgi:hypothetical protein